MPFTFYKQNETMDCGPTCLRMVAKFYGKRISLETLREKAHIGKQGVNLLGISEAAESIGFRTQAAKIPLSTLINDVKLPAILFWNQNHFIILYKAKKEKFFIIDPAKGFVTLTTEEFKGSWVTHRREGKEEGIALILEPSPLFHSQDEESAFKRKGGSEFANFFNYLLPYKTLIFQVLLGMGIAGLLQLFLPFLTQSIVDTGVNSANMHFVYIVLLAQLSLLAGRMVIEFIRGWILLHISTRINVSILTDFLIKLMKLPVSYFDSKQTGDIMQRMNDHKRIENFLTGTSLSVFFSLSNLFILSIVLAIYNLGIFTIFLIGTLLYSLWMIAFLKKLRILDYKRFAVAAKDQSISIQLVQGMQEIKLHGVEQPMRWTWEKLQAKLFRLNVQGLSINQWQQAGAFLLNEGKNILITFFAAKAVIDGKMTLGSMLAVQYIIGQLNSPIEQLLSFAQNMQSARISMERLDEIHSLNDEEPPERLFIQELPTNFSKKLLGGKMPVVQAELTATRPKDLAGQEHLQGVDIVEQQAITFHNLTYVYPGAGYEPVLKDINLRIPLGKTTAIVGISGSGKTTLLKLLLKFYEPQKGEIKYNGTPLRNISHKTWRSHCGVVMQDSFIFSESIAKNIAVGAESPEIEKLDYAAEIANIRDFISELPLGYNTIIGAEGTGISMGQKQRILIARAVYRDPQFIFFDEATNSLDANNESTIIQNLDAFFKNRTVVVVAHRLSTVKHADQIVLLKRGVVKEVGTHHQLVGIKGDYYQLVRNQLDLENQI